MHIHRTAQVAFIFGGFFGQNVAFEGLTAFNSTTWTNAKAFFRAAFGLHFGHVYAPYVFCLNFRRLVHPLPNTWGAQLSYSFTKLLESSPARQRPFCR